MAGFIRTERRKQHRRAAMTLRMALLRLILITLLPLAAASGLIGWQLWHAQETAAEESLKDTASALLLAVDRDVAGVRGQLEALAASPMIDEGRWQELHTFLRSIAALRPNAVVAIIDGSGQVRVQTNFEFGAAMPNLWEVESRHETAVWNGHTLPRTSQGLSRQVFVSGAPAVSGLYVSLVGRAVVGLSVPVKRNGSVRYAMVYSFPTESLERFFGEPDATGLRLTLVDRTGVLIARSSASPEEVGSRVDVGPQPDTEVTGLRLMQRVAADGVRVLSALVVSETTGWTLRVSQPVSEALAPAYHAARVWGVLFVIVLLIAVAAAIVLSRRLAMPLVDLAQHAGVSIAPARMTGIREIDVLTERLAHASQSELERRTEIERRVAAEERERAAAASERIVREHMAELEDADRRKDHFLAMLGHELRNPLSPIMNSARLLRESEPDAETVERSATVIERQVQHLARLIDDLLDVARITEGKIVLKRQRVELLPLLYQALESTRGLIEARNQRLTIHTPTSPVSLDADPARVVQVLTNLLNNAAKYTPNGGAIDVAAEREGEAVCIRVRDDGVGIAPDVLPRLFVAFAQGPEARERSQGGLGIGLALAKRLVEMHGGSVEAASPGLGKGSVFTVRLPLAAAAASPGASHGTVTAANNSGALRCLVVDDNVDAADSLVALLQAAGHRAVACYDAASALRAWPGERPELAILDIGLPGIDGYELARRIRALEGGRSVFLAALTGYGQGSDAARAAVAGFDVHLVKPLLPDALERLLERAVTFMAQTTEPPV